MHSVTPQIFTCSQHKLIFNLPVQWNPGRVVQKKLDGSQLSGKSPQALMIPNCQFFSPPSLGISYNLCLFHLFVYTHCCCWITQRTGRDLLAKELQPFWKLQPFCWEARPYQTRAPQPFQEKQMRFLHLLTSSHPERAETNVRKQQTGTGRLPLVTDRSVPPASPYSWFGVM